MFSGQGSCNVRVVHHRQSCGGKTFQRGRRVTFWWSAVRRGITGVDTGRELSSLLLAAVGEQGMPESPPFTIEGATEFSEAYCDHRVLPALADLRQSLLVSRAK